jgi:hypothetical protein
MFHYLHNTPIKEDIKAALLPSPVFYNTSGMGEFAFIDLRLE